MPAANIGFNSTGTVYHSLYDTVRYVERFADPGLKGVTAAAEVSGSLALRLANADIYPMKYSDYAADTLQRLEAMGKEAPNGSSLATTMDAAREWGAAAAGAEPSPAAEAAAEGKERPAAASGVPHLRVPQGLRSITEARPAHSGLHLAGLCRRR